MNFRISGNDKNLIIFKEDQAVGAWNFLENKGAVKMNYVDREEVDLKFSSFLFLLEDLWGIDLKNFISNISNLGAEK